MDKYIDRCIPNFDNCSPRQNSYIKLENSIQNLNSYTPKIQEYTIPRVIGIKQCAKEFGIAEYAIKQWVHSGELPCIRCGKKILINCTVMADFLSCKSSISNAVATDEQGNYYAPVTENKANTADVKAVRNIKNYGKIRKVY